MLRGRPEAVQPGQNPGRWNPSWDSPAQPECDSEGVSVLREAQGPQMSPRGRGWGLCEQQDRGRPFLILVWLVWVEVSFLGGGTLTLETDRKRNISRYSKFTAYENKAPSPKANHSC